MNFIMIGQLPREALDRLRVRLNMYLVVQRIHNKCWFVTAQATFIDFLFFTWLFTCLIHNNNEIVNRTPTSWWLRLYLSRGSTTADGSPAAPIRQVPTGEPPDNVIYRRWQWMYDSVKLPWCTHSGNWRLVICMLQSFITLALIRRRMNWNPASKIKLYLPVDSLPSQYYPGLAQHNFFDRDQRPTGYQFYH